MTTASLKSYSHKDLAEMARRGGVRGWHAMRKDQLVKALVTAAKKKSLKARSAKKPDPPARRSSPAKRSEPASARTASPSRNNTNNNKQTSPRVLKHISQVKAKLGRSKNLATSPSRGKTNGHVRDRVVVMVRDPF